MSASEDEDVNNFQTFRECLSVAILRHGQAQTPKISKKRRPVSDKPHVSSKARRSVTAITEVAREDPIEMAEFIDYLASEIFLSLPEKFRILSYSVLRNDPPLSGRIDDPLSEGRIEQIISTIPVEVEESLVTYGYVEPPKTDVTSFMTPVLNSYVSAATAPPPEWVTTRTTACEICERDWIPLTYHHLIPRGIHAKVLKRGWHEEWTLNSVAWLCRACHSFVHRMATNEELAREWYTIDKIMSNEDVQNWAAWVGRVRWKTR